MSTTDVVLKVFVATGEWLNHHPQLYESTAAMWAATALLLCLNSIHRFVRMLLAMVLGGMYGVALPFIVAVGHPASDGQAVVLMLLVMPFVCATV